MTRLVVSLCLLALVVAATIAAPATPNSKVQYSLRKSLETKSRVNILVSMKQTTDAALAQVSARTFATRGERATAVYTSLKALADKSQAATLEMLNSPRFFAINVRSFWITNQIYVQGADKYLIDSLAEMDDVASIEEEEIVYLQEPETDEQNTIRAEWGIEKIQAPEAWEALGSAGEGAVVGVIDTGARYTHTLLRDSYKGGNHAWYNPYVSQPNPTDGHGHGTHMTGIAAGSGGIGVAPDAKWISCKGLRDDGSGTNAGLIACGQFMACPHNYQGGSPDCSQAPDVVIIGWGGSGGANWYDSVLRAWQTAGVIPFAGASNSGPGCSSIAYPADSPLVISVGATTSTDSIASFSGRGPSNSGTHKPDIVAPGSSIRSAGHTSDTAFVTLSGTPFAAAHAAGVATLLRSGRPDSSFTVVKNNLQDNADRILSFTGQSCGGIPENVFPNYIFGYGRVNALRSVNALLAMSEIPG